MSSLEQFWKRNLRNFGLSAGCKIWRPSRPLLKLNINEDDEEGPVFENEQEELETFRSLKFSSGLLRLFRDARNADFQDVCIYTHPRT